jgi:hypothetical protein
MSATDPNVTRKSFKSDVTRGKNFERDEAQTFSPLHDLFFPWDLDVVALEVLSDATSK